MSIMLLRFAVFTFDCLKYKLLINKSFNLVEN